MKVGTEQEWQAARKQLLAAERELETHAERVAEQRRELPWVPVEQEYTLTTEEGLRTLPELFDGRPRLLRPRRGRGYVRGGRDDASIPKEITVVSTTSDRFAMLRRRVDWGDDAGFSRFRMHDFEDPANLYYEIRP